MPGFTSSGLTAKATQERFGASAPVAGILLEKMIVNDGATVPVNFGGRVVWEADMLLVVKDNGINAAKTPGYALKHIRAMRPFIELPDFALDPKEKLDGVQLAAINVAARLGVVGPEVALEPSADTLRRLAEMKIIATDGSGASLAENTGAATLGKRSSACRRTRGRRLAPCNGCADGAAGLTDNDSLLAIAYHEAGHAVMAHHLRVPIYSVTIVPDDDTDGCVMRQKLENIAIFDLDIVLDQNIRDPGSYIVRMPPVINNLDDWDRMAQEQLRQEEQAADDKPN